MTKLCLSSIFLIYLCRLLQFQLPDIMAQPLRDSKDYSSLLCEQSRDHKDRQQNCPVSSSTPRSIKLSSATSSGSESCLPAFSDAFDLPPAPDGGWGWWVVLGAFFLNFICDGSALSFGVMFVYLIEEFQQTKSETAWVASIFYCLSLLLGPVASVLATRFDCRSVTIAAGLLSCMGFVASSFVTSIWHLYITFGVIVGASFSVCYVTSVLTVAYYFDKRRALAIGLSLCGTGIGTFTFAPVCEILIGMYGWRGTFLIMGAVSLHICVCGALFRPLTFIPEQRRRCQLNAKQFSVTVEVARGNSGDLLLESRGKKREKKHCTRGEDETDPNKNLSEKLVQQLTDKLLESSADTGSVRSTEDQLQSHDVPTSGRELEQKQSEKTPCKLQCKVESGSALERSLSDKLPVKIQCQRDSGATLEYFMFQKKFTEHHRKITTGSAAILPSGVDPTISGGTNLEMPQVNKHSSYLILHRSDIFFGGSYTQRPAPRASSCPELSQPHQCPRLEPVINSLTGTFDKKITRHPLFVLLALSTFLLYFWGDVPYVFATDFALSRDIPNSQATFLISIIGIVNTVGQVIYGLVGDQDWNLTVIYGISCIGCGLAVLLLPTAESYWLMSVLCGLFAFFESADCSLTTVMLVRYLGLEKLANSYGLIMMIQGLANLGGLPMAGWIVDKSGNYGMAFQFAGGFIMLSGAIVFLFYITRLCGRFLSGLSHTPQPPPQVISGHTRRPQRQKRCFLLG